MNLVNQSIEITLKEITDLVEVRHNDAMSKIEKLAEEPSFGSLRKIRSQYTSGKGRIDEIETYLLTEKQAIAAAAKLNNSMLMKVIDRLEQLEKNWQQPVQQPAKVKPIEMFRMVLETMEDQEARLTRLEQTSTIDSAQQAKIQTEVGKRVRDIIQKHNLSQADKSKLFSRVYSMLKKEFIVGSYKDIPKVRYDNAINLIRNAPFGGML